MKNILIPTDFSKNSKNAIQYAMAFFQNTACNFFILFANVEGKDYLEKPSYQLGTGILVEKESKTIDEKLTDLENELKLVSKEKENHHFTLVHAKGHFLKSIKDQVAQNRIELIVMGTKGATEVKEFFTGTHAGDVITKVECNVLVVPSKTSFKGLGEIVFSTDLDFEYSDVVFRSITEIMGSSKTNFHLLYVNRPVKTLSKQKHDVKEAIMKRFSTVLENPITFHKVNYKKVEDAIRLFAQSINADLIIMVSKDYNFLQKQFLDTTVEEVSFDTKIPLLSLQG
ncbi:hypothetical protein MTsPCn9_29300 [Croceitalea sp. MTPC9]|uniref:universal stress protein n=1 Tax=unclassified Croceitalea TaxID=2632280 RepID=UPI002B3FC25A|nr:hypothetical protein MTsPCn6_30790 [Croceitalea sp. MTPC6]GMN17990.1 hypothetical protein MTsPCn9_29300 [Croceitalea sp. MTPC9]